MSEYFQGVTFANQNVSPVDDAVLRRRLLSDGILTGCAFTYAGYTLTMASGYLIACGRQIRRPTAENWAISDATSGYARVLMTIDLTRTATEEVFDQVNTSIEYATSEDGFPALIQDDINATGSQYQVALAVVSLGTGGITGVVSKLEQAESSGGGKAFAAISVTYPEGSVCTCTNGTKTLKAKDTCGKYLFLLPEGGTWTVSCTDGSQTANFYATVEQNCSYAITLSYELYLYNAGDQCTSVTGGWGTSGYSYSGRTVSAGILESDKMSLVGSSTYAVMLGTANAIDVTDYSTLYVEGEPTGTINNVSINAAVCTSKVASTKAAEISFGGDLSRSVKSVDISGITGNVYITVYAQFSDSCNGNIYKAWLA